jgi:hypothetical protein
MAPAKKAKARRHAVRKAAKARRHAVKRAVPPRKPDDDYSIEEWCAKRRISKVHFYAMLKAGLAPKTMKLKKRRTISPEADAEWQRERERETAEATPR